MKKFMFIAALALFTFSANAQTDKEAAKALKEAQKNAEKLVKKARSEYEASIANPQMGKKETDFAKLDGAKALIEQALADKMNASNSECYRTAADITAQYYNKFNDATKANPDDEAAKTELLKTAQKLVEYSCKYDEFENAKEKKNAAEYTKNHTYYQNLSVNPLILCLQAAQNYSTSDKQEELKFGNSLATSVIDGFTKTHLMSDFTNDSKADWILYAKAFKAQSAAAIEGASSDEVEASWNDLVGTKYESTAYSALANYFREKNADKYIQYLTKGMEVADDTTFPAFAFMLMQYQFQNDKKDDCVKTIQLIKQKCPDNENTVSAYLMEGQIYFEQKQFDKAEALFAEAVQKFPNDERAITMPAKCAWMKAQNSGDKKDMEHAIQLFKKLEADYPNETEYWGEPLYILYNNTNNNAARDKYKKYYNVK